MSAATATALAPPISLHGVGAAYGRIEVLHGVDIAVPRHGVAALLGPNGAGKTTAMSVMSGLLQPTRGCRHVDGRHLNGVRPDELARAGVCHIREGRSVFPNLSVLDNLTVASSRGVARQHVVEVAFSLFPQLKNRQNQLAGNLSGGEKAWPVADTLADQGIPFVLSSGGDEIAEGHADRGRLTKPYTMDGVEKALAGLE